MADDPPPPPQVTCRNPACRHAFGPIEKDQFGRVHLTLGGQPVYVLAGSSIMLPCPRCGQWRQFAGGGKRKAMAGMVDTNTG